MSVIHHLRPEVRVEVAGIDEVGHVLTALDLELAWTGLGPVCLRRVLGSELVCSSTIPLVSVFTADEQRGRSSQNYLRSAVGDRLRYTRHRITESDAARCLQVEQQDPVSGLTVVTMIERPHALPAYRFTQRVTNDGARDIVVTAITSATLGFGTRQSDLDELDLCWGDSEWVAEGRWQQQPLRRALPRLNLPLHQQDARGRWARTSHGTWSTGSALPTGIIAGRSTSIAWQVETSGPWHVELSQTATSGVLVAAGPMHEHGFAATLAPGQSTETVPAAVVFAHGGRDSAVAELTRYRRWLRSRELVSADLPVIYNDFMNTLMGEPSTERVEPLVAAAADAGAEYFCIDAGWFAEPDHGDWWSSVGEWREAPGRFSGGLKALIEKIHAAGMRSGLWLEPEVVGIDSPVAAALPEEAFFHLHGARVREANRFHLDFRHPAARKHLDDTVDHLVAEYGIGFLKLDYNINPGAGTDHGASSAAQGLLEHTRAFRRWLQDLKRRHPGVLIENCSSGAMRMDYSLLSVTDLQSTSDQQDHRLYPPVAVAAPASILPEQCGNWAYPAATMSDEETAFSMVAGIVGRLYLSGFLHDLRPEQTELVARAVDLHKHIRAQIAASFPEWPLGLPAWDDDVMALTLTRGSDRLLAVWSRAGTPRNINIAGRYDTVAEIYPCRTDLGVWTVQQRPTELIVNIPPGPTARVYRLTGPG
jgi:alpha-galactosidase